MCRVLRVHRSGFYRWLLKPLSNRAIEDKILLSEIKHFFEESDRTYGSPRIYLDLKEAGFHCGRKRVERLMRSNKIKALRTYKRRYVKYGKPAITAPNHLQQDFKAERPNQRWVTDITQVRTHEGWLYVAAVEDLFSRKIIGWSMQSTIKRDIVLDALLMAVWRRNPEGEVIIHSDQGTQYSSGDWRTFCKLHGLTMSMSRRGNCFDNAVMESFNSTLKKERVRGQIYKTRAEAKSDIFDYIEFFYNTKRRHSYIGYKSPEQYEKEFLTAG